MLQRYRISVIHKNFSEEISEIMELFERILTKTEINNRFITAVHAVLANGLISSKTGLAESLKVKPAKFSEILNRRMNVGVDMLAIMCDFYRVSPDWLLMSRGNNVFRTTELPKIWVDDEDLNNRIPKEDSNPITGTHKPTEIAPFLDLIQKKDEVIREQAEEIGQLKERVAQLERGKAANSSSAQDAPFAPSAHAG